MCLLPSGKSKEPWRLALYLLYLPLSSPPTILSRVLEFEDFETSMQRQVCKD